MYRQRDIVRKGKKVRKLKSDERVNVSLYRMHCFSCGTITDHKIEKFVDSRQAKFSCIDCRRVQFALFDEVEVSGRGIA